MCGINGFTFKDDLLIAKMNDLISHRGPDGSGSFSDEYVTLGHRRLKIIDLSAKASQPMFDDKHELALVFNGEIYNFMDVKKILEDDGYKFRSHSDSEVILYSYKKWGPDCVKHFNGMWAFAIYDMKNRKVFLSRDRLGKKPLFYCIKDGSLVFSSEIRPFFIHGIKKELNPKAVSSFLSYRYVLGNETMFKNIYKLPPASSMLFSLTKRKIEKIWEYWDLEDADSEMTLEDAESQVDGLLKDAVKLRQISDVPIGSINSGGLKPCLRDNGKDKSPQNTDIHCEIPGKGI